MKSELGKPCKVKLWGSNGGHKGLLVREVRRWSRSCLVGKNSLSASSGVREGRAWDRRQGEESM